MLLLAMAPLGALGAPELAEAESAIVLETPTDVQRINATTFDERGREIGRSFFELEKLTTDTKRMTIELVAEDGGSNRSEATLESAPDGTRGIEGLRLRTQRSQATRADGVALDLLVIDHVARRVSCYSDANDPASGRHVDLPASDRVVNVPLQLLLQPLARGEVDRIRFQLALCRSKPHLQDMVALRGPRAKRHGRDVIEVRYGPDFGDTVAFLASRLLPRFSFWFEPEDGGYLGHRMPLYRRGPNVLLLRQGMEPVDLGIAMR